MTNYLGRPKLKIPKSKSEWLWDVVGYLTYFGSIIFLISVWSSLPDKVPGHYNALGEVDRWGSKWELIILPIIAAFILLVTQILEKFPEVHNYPQRLNESNAERFYLASRKLINQVKNICIIIFSFILFESVSIALEWGGGFGKWFLPLIIIGPSVSIVISIIKQRKIK
ncbi:DUF1648 domain-containing protein [Pseudoneobacillus sp. C159]